MKSDQLANGPKPTNPTKHEGEKCHAGAQFFRDVLVGCVIAAGWGFFQTARAVTKRVFTRDDAE